MFICLVFPLLNRCYQYYGVNNLYYDDIQHIIIIKNKCVCHMVSCLIVRNGKKHPKKEKTIGYWMRNHVWYNIQNNWNAAAVKQSRWNNANFYFCLFSLNVCFIVVNKRHICFFITTMLFIGIIELNSSFHFTYRFQEFQEFFYSL